jgi:hypothetical protein
MLATFYGELRKILRTFKQQAAFSGGTLQVQDCDSAAAAGGFK